MPQSSIILITGASRGLGRELGVELARRGHQVYGGARSRPEGESGFVELELDVTDDASVAEAVARVVAAEGRLDVLVNNAGITHCGAVEEAPLAAARQVFETNYLGAVRLIQAALPIMRSQGRGLIVNIGSAAGQIGIPFQGHYAASKFALEGLSEALRDELSGFGIRVLLIEPGDVFTTIWERSEPRIPPGSAYEPALRRFLAVKEIEMGSGATPPADAAREIADIILSGTTRLRHPVGRGARLILLARKLLPDGIFLRLVAKHYKVQGKKV